MARTLWFGHDGALDVDESLVHVIVSNYLLARLMEQHAQVLPSALDPELRGLHGYPDTCRVDVDMAAVARERDAQLPGLLAEVRRAALDGPHGLQAARLQLGQMEAETRFFRDRLFAQMKTAQSISLEHVRQRVRNLERSEKALEVVVRLSATTVLVLAPYAGAVAGYSALGVGAGLGGYGTFLETHDVGRTTVEVSAALLTGVIPISAAQAGVTQFEPAEKAGVAVVACAIDIGRSAAAGEPIANWAVHCGFDAARPFAEKAFALQPIRRALARSVLPVATRLAGERGGALAQGAVLEPLFQGLDAGVSALLHDHASAAAPQALASPATPGQLPLLVVDQDLAGSAIRPAGEW